MEVGCVLGMPTGERTRATTAYLTFVALDDRERPTPIAPIRPLSSL
jgi:acyl-CoA hydrolase